MSIFCDFELACDCECMMREDDADVYHEFQYKQSFLSERDDGEHDFAIFQLGGIISRRHS